VRFRSPPREAVAPAQFEHPVFAGVTPWRDWLVADEWPSVEVIDAQLQQHGHAITGRPLRALMQTPALLTEGLHYETRIFQRGEIATRAGCWHDLLNALVWLAHSGIKSALNARQAADIDRVGPRIRTRGQCALTHFDEAGAVIALRDPARLRAWDAHDWPGLFTGLASDEWAVAVIGHALLEHALIPEQTLVGKALVLLADQPPNALALAMPEIANQVQDGHILADPQELRPLPLMGLPGWHPLAGQRAFLASAPCFAAKRAERIYPSPLAISVGALNAAA